ncbi:MAG: putative Ig domain-containing protein [Raineya sp.]|jgi:uncharacterized delta-60 repeat protein|nr:putative Ig domain-containing protein [Raineya sp.]
MRFIFCILLIFFYYFDGIAQSFKNDETFHTEDNSLQLMHLFAESVPVTTSVIQPDGKVIIGGDFAKGILRLNVDGSIDPSFQIGNGFGMLRSSSSGNLVTSIVLQPDGKILVAGGLREYNNVPCKMVVRLNSDGSLDTSFNPPSLLNNFSDLIYVSSIALRSDGKVIAVYSLGMNIYCLNPDGSLDNSFQSNLPNIYSVSYRKVYVQADGKILLGGRFEVNGHYNVIRLNSDGSLDNTFQSAFDSPSTAVTIHTLLVDDNNKILIAGSFSQEIGGITFSNIARLNMDGSVDHSFNTNGIIGSTVRSLAIQSDGKILVGGNYTNYSSVCQVARLNINGSLDTSFFVSYNLAGGVHTISIQSDGKILIGGSMSQINNIRPINAFARLNLDGTIDNSFKTNTGIHHSGSPSIIIPQDNNKILVAGIFSSYDDVPCSYITRLNMDGTVDNTFNISGGTNNGGITTVAIQLDGKILIGGTFTRFNGNNGHNRILRVNSDGSLDNTFNPGTAFSNDVHYIKVQPDGKILVGGSFLNFQGNYNPFIIRLNPDGSKDNTFNPPSPSFAIYHIAIQPDGKIILGGDGFRLYRLNSDGSLDNTFLNCDCAGYAKKIYIQPDGKIVLINQSIIIRLNSNGSLDNTFKKITGFNENLNGSIKDAVVESNGKILVVGHFTKYNNHNHPYILRFNSVGDVDGAIDSGEGFNSPIYSIFKDSNEKIWVVGIFNYYNDIARNRIAKLISCPESVISPALLPDSQPFVAYNQNITQTGLPGSVSWSISNGNLPNGLTLNSITGQISGTPTETGVFNFQVKVKNASCSAIKNYTISICPSITITPNNLSNGVIGASYNQTITQTGLSGITSWSIINGFLPTGLSLNTSTGQISGTPIHVETADITVQVIDGRGCKQTKVYNLVINCPPLVFNNTNASNAILGTFYNLNAGVSGNTNSVIYSISPALPAGLTLNPFNGQISGIPMSPNTSTTYTVTANQNYNSGSCTVSQNYTFAVVCPSASLTPTTLSNGVEGNNYNQVITQTGLSAGTITWSIISGNLPNGLSLNTSTGQINGIPTSIGIFNFTIQASSGSCFASRAYSIVISCPSINILPSSLINGDLESFYSQTLTQTGLSVGTITWSIISGNLPNGLSLNTSSGVISGTPTIVGSSSFTIQVTNGNCSKTQSYTIDIINNNPILSFDNNLATLIKVFPNPSTGNFHIDFGNINTINAFVSVYDIQGRRLFINEVQTNTMDISLEKFGTGVYILEVETIEGKVFKKLLKQ